MSASPFLAARIKVSSAYISIYQFADFSCSGWVPFWKEGRLRIVNEHRHISRGQKGWLRTTSGNTKALRALARSCAPTSHHVTEMIWNAETGHCIDQTCCGNCCGISHVSGPFPRASALGGRWLDGGMDSFHATPSWLNLRKPDMNADHHPPNESAWLTWLATVLGVWQG